MISRILHLNCGTMCPLCQRLVNGGSWTKPGKLVCHCLLLETSVGLLLVDSGIGTQDILNTKQRIGLGFVRVFKPKLDLNETAIEQIKLMGYDPAEVKHIIPTHLDLDHAGGLADFPDAHVHVLASELKQITQPGLRERFRFRLKQFSHQPKWVTYTTADEDWFGLQALSPIAALSEHLKIVPLIGHTRGHVGIAVRKPEGGWLLHCGDAYYHHSEVTAQPNMPSGLKIFERMVETLHQPRITNLNRLQRLALEHKDQVELICAHDPVELERYQT